MKDLKMTDKTYLSNSDVTAMAAELASSIPAGAKVYGMVTLMAVELVICAVPLALAVLFFRDAPPTPPSHSTNLKLEVRICVVNAI